MLMDEEATALDLYLVYFERKPHVPNTLVPQAVPLFLAHPVLFEGLVAH